MADIFNLNGNTRTTVRADVVRPLVRADLELLAAVPHPAANAVSAVKRLTDRHHALARNLAAGTPIGEAAVMVGLTLNRCSILMTDPAFIELLSFYREDVTKVYRDMHEKLAGISSTALDELADRLEDEPEKVSTNALLDIIKMGADRTGHGPQSMQTNVNLNVDMASRLEAARRRVQQRTLVIE